MQTDQPVRVSSSNTCSIYYYCKKTPKRYDPPPASHKPEAPLLGNEPGFLWWLTSGYSILDASVSVLQLPFSVIKSWIGKTLYHKHLEAFKGESKCMYEGLSCLLRYICEFFAFQWNNVLLFFFECAESPVCITQKQPASEYKALHLLLEVFQARGIQVYITDWTVWPFFCGVLQFNAGAATTWAVRCT